MSGAAANWRLNIVGSLAAWGRLLVATAALSFPATLTVFEQSAGAQPSTQNAGAQPSTQNVEELKQKLAELEKEVEALRKSVKQLEEQQKLLHIGQPDLASAQTLPVHCRR
jgi:TolA-binding protein